VRILAFLAVILISTPAHAGDIYETLAQAPKASWHSTNSANLESCIILTLANRSRQAPTVAKRPGETIIVVHDWDSPVPGNKVQGLVTIKADGLVEFRGAKDWLPKLIEPCTKL
jgi:hypothetical protein